jgi:hypothetical protein
MKKISQSPETSSLEPITLAESQRLIALERIIEAGKQTFLEVGTALLEIRDSRLYKCDFKTFQDYCIYKWGFSKTYANNLIEGAFTVKQLPPNLTTTVVNERQARTLAKVPKEEREAVLMTATATAKAESRPMTANDIKHATVRAAGTKKKIAREMWFYGWWRKNATPERRGHFIHEFFVSKRPVMVDNKEAFKTLVMQWLDEDVKEARDNQNAR